MPTRAEQLAARTGSSRSHLYARALAAFLEAEGDDPVTQRLDEIAGGNDTTLAPHLDIIGRRLIEQSRWEW